MAQKYLKYFVTRENQFITDGFFNYVKNFPKDKHLLNSMSIHTWHMYEMVQDAFYCNWPNTSFKKYFIQATPLIVEESPTFDGGVYDYFGLLFVNPTNQKLVFSVDGQTQEIALTSSTILISPHQKETYTITGDPLLVIKFKISSSVVPEENWIPF